MTLTATPTQTVANQSTGQAGIPWPYHVAAAAWVVTMLGLARIAPVRYERLLQEDGIVEWLTVTLFLAAAWLRMRSAWPVRRVFDLLIAAFCLFVAGEEFSWGQRLLGFTPPAVFLEHNTQQEFTLHNFADVFGKPKGVLILALLGYGVLLPLLSRVKWFDKLGATPPPRAALPWFVIAAGLLLWYPVDLTGEWVEALAASAFFVSARPASRARRISIAGALAGAVLLTLYSAHQVAASPAALACAEREARALVDDIAQRAATERLLDRAGSVHKRLWTAIDDGYIDQAQLTTFKREACGQSPRYLIDPWGMAYWLRYDPDEGKLEVYSMGPNRRRDADDIVAAFRR